MVVKEDAGEETGNDDKRQGSSDAAGGNIEEIEGQQQVATARAAAGYGDVVAWQGRQSATAEDNDATTWQVRLRLRKRKATMTSSGSGCCIGRRHSWEQLQQQAG
ncbi:hypothetical protein BHE74_00056655 [Ensete ventricosum]|nr:hypothetical protein BHE74_00056655 [Ensete ventricosum]